MARRLPPLSALRFFEAAGRHLSFKRAAAELNVTASAVSHGIIGLELELGIALFVRAPGGLALTPEGADYLPYASEALSLIAIGTERMPGRRGRAAIALSCAPAFAARWLLPRLPRFCALAPDVGITLDASRRQVGFPVDGFDFAIRMSRTGAAGPAWTRLFGEMLVPVCSPGLRDTLRDAAGTVDLRRARLIHVTAASEEWRAWVERTGAADMAEIEAARGLRFDTIELATQAAVMGLGLALGRRPLIDAELDAGTLVEVGPGAIAAETAYWLVTSDGAERRPDMAAFRRWLLGEAADFATTVGTG